MNRKEYKALVQAIKLSEPQPTYMPEDYDDYGARLSAWKSVVESIGSALSELDLQFCVARFERDCGIPRKRRGGGAAYQKLIST